MFIFIKQYCYKVLTIIGAHTHTRIPPIKLLKLEVPQTQEVLLRNLILEKQ